MLIFVLHTFLVAKEVAVAEYLLVAVAEYLLVAVVIA